MTERLAVEANGTRVDEQRFPGRQGRIVFAYLAAQNGRPVPRDELAEVLWGEELPATWEKALRVLMTKLRTLLTECGIDGSSALTSAFGCYQLTLPPGAWIDVHAAATAVDEADAALAAGELATARAKASTAAELARRVFLPGEEGPWVEDQRRGLRDILVRALECLRDVALAEGRFGDAVRHAAEITELEPFRESSYRALMQAHAAAGDRAEALRVYERCRRFLAEELGAYPSPESEAAYRELLRSSPGVAGAEMDGRGADGAGLETPSTHDERPPRGRGRVALLVAGAVLVAAGAGAIALVLGTSESAPPKVLPNSIVRLDPETLKPTQVVKIGPRADLVVAAGGYVWVAHGSLRYTSDGLRNAGDRALTRIDPSTGESRGVGGLAPCGLTADPSGDVWVANCFAAGQNASVTRVEAKTLVFEPTWLFPPTDGYYRGLAYGNGSLWAAAVSGGAVQGRGLTRLGPGNQRRSIALAQHPNALSWSDYGDLWMTNFDDGSVSRLKAETGEVMPFEAVANHPGALVAQGDSVWVGDWSAPDVVRLPAVGAAPPRHISLDVTATRAGVTSVAAGAGAIWATVPDDHALWRIDPRTRRPTRIELGYYPWGVAVGDDGIWVALRARDA